MLNIPLEVTINENLSSQLCIGIVNQNTKQQCSRKGKKEFGNLCGLEKRWFLCVVLCPALSSSFVSFLRSITSSPITFLPSLSFLFLP